MAETAPTIRVQICYASASLQVLHDVDVPLGTTLQEAIIQSGLLCQMPEIDLAISRAGIYGKLKSLDTVLREHDRVEIYRPLTADPKEARRRRVVKKSNKKACG